MPIVNTINPSLDVPVRTFIATASSYRLQLAALPDTKDPETGRIKKGEHQVAQFRHGFFKTNIPEIIKRIEESYAYGTDVKDYDQLIFEGKERRYQDLLAMAKDDKDMMERLKKDLEKRTTKEQKERASEINAELKTSVSPTPAV